MEDSTKSVCRVCMSSYVTLMELFVEPKQPLVEEPSVAEMLAECVECEVKFDDPLPKMICLSCVIETKNAFRFKRRCEESHKNFWEMHNKQSKIIDEPMMIKVEPPEIAEEKPPKEKQVPGSFIMSINTKSESTDDSPLSVQSLLSDTHNNLTLPQPIQSYKCPHCNRAFRQRLTLLGHIKVHGKTPYKCRHCTASFAQQEQLTEHLSTHIVEQRFECAKCLKLFSTELNLQLHSRSHGISQHRRYECPHCLKCFGQLGGLQKHMRIHAPHKCPYCPMSFPRKQDVNYHVLVHTGERPHKCSECGKAFKKKQHVEYHMLTHLGQRVL